MIVFSTKSWHFWWYKIVYGSWRSQPTNLCPYFWKIVLSLILIPLLPFWMIGTGINKVVSRGDGILDDEEYDGVWGFPTLLGMIATIAGIVLFSMIAVWFISWKNKSGNEWIKVLGGIGYAICLLLLGREIFVKIQELRYMRDPKPKHNNLLVEMIKAKYNKYCPRIEWDEED